MLSQLTIVYNLHIKFSISSSHNMPYKLKLSVSSSLNIPLPAMVQQHTAGSLFYLRGDHLIGQVVKASAPKVEGPEFESHLRRDISRSSHKGDLNIGTPVATLQGAWRYRVSTGTGRPGVSILWLGEGESLICYFYLRVAARTIVWVDLSLRYTSMLLGR